MARDVVIIGMLGSNLDRMPRNERWERWRPTISLFQREDLLIRRMHLLHAPEHSRLCAEVVADIQLVSPETTVIPREILIQDPWDFEEVYGALHDMARSTPFNPETEDILVHITTGTHVVQICLFLLVESRHIPGRLVQTSPPRSKDSPGGLSVIDLDLGRYDRLAARFATERAEGAALLKSGIPTQNAQFNALMDEIGLVAVSSDAPILLLGPTGSGKSQLAAQIVALKRARRRIEGQFVEVNCATLRGDAAMSALFGHVKGAYTGAVTAREGLLRAANGGVLFLDEVGELGLDEQATLLRAIEQGRFAPVGADQEVQSRFQLITGTNRDLTVEAQAGRFRADLLARMDLWSFTLPALRERPEDIEPNLDYELELVRRRSGVSVTFSAEARARFLAFATGPEGLWPGNFRDLGAAITRLATLAPGGRVRVEDVERELTRLRRAWSPAANPSDAGDRLGRELLGDAAWDELDRFDQVQLAEVLRVVQASPSLAAAGRVLFAQSRARRGSPNDSDRLRKYLAGFGLTGAELLRR
ncbi:MAG: sigma 54-interacting transcriptional regulator [Deltaproteobacteria bacterium]|nr:sigma 54-interacting transcriptional regulator [Deltaproteobacteria bacterium]